MSHPKCYHFVKESSSVWLTRVIHASFRDYHLLELWLNYVCLYYSDYAALNLDDFGFTSYS